MKRILLGLVAVALVMGATLPAGAQTRRPNSLGPVKWVKGNTGDSTNVHMLFVAATNGSDPDTTQAFDLGVFRSPVRYFANDSLVIISAYLHWDGEAAADTMRVTIQYSTDGTKWTTQKVVTVVGLAGTAVDSYRLTNQVAAMDPPTRYIRWIATNFDQSAEGAPSVTGHEFTLSLVTLRGD